MRRMRLMPQSIEEKNVQAFQLSERRFWNLAKIGEVGGGAKAKSDDLRVAMHDLDRLESCPEELHRPVDVVHLHLREPSILVCGVEDVAEHVAQEICRVRARVERNSVAAM